MWHSHAPVYFKALLETYFAKVAHKDGLQEELGLQSKLMNTRLFYILFNKQTNCLNMQSSLETTRVSNNAEKSPI